LDPQQQTGPGEAGWSAGTCGFSVPLLTYRFVMARVKQPRR